ncbi:hypothetical protein D1872_353900 [compost metagenome]
MSAKMLTAVNDGYACGDRLQFVRPIHSGIPAAGNEHPLVPEYLQFLHGIMQVADLIALGSLNLQLCHL